MTSNSNKAKIAEKMIQINAHDNCTNDKAYRILDWRACSIKNGEFDGVKISKIKEYGDELYRIYGNDEFIEYAMNSGIIEEAGNTIEVFSPEDIKFFIKSVDKYVYDHEHIEYTIHTDAGAMTIRSRDMFSLNKWKPLMLDHCDILMAFSLKQKGFSAQFNKLICYVRDHAVEKWCEKVSVDDVEADAIMQEIRLLPIVINKEDFGTDVVWHKDGIYRVMSTTVRDIVGRIGGDFSSHTNKVLTPFLVDASKQITINGVRMSIWQFEQW